MEDDKYRLAMVRKDPLEKVKIVSKMRLCVCFLCVCAACIRLFICIIKCVSSRHGAKASAREGVFTACC